MARVSDRSTALDALAGGGEAGAAVAACTGSDDGREHRQLGVVGVDSQATWTGRFSAAITSMAANTASGSSWILPRL